MLASFDSPHSTASVSMGDVRGKWTDPGRYWPEYADLDASDLEGCWSAGGSPSGPAGGEKDSDAEFSFVDMVKTYRAGEGDGYEGHLLYGKDALNDAASDHPWKGGTVADDVGEGMGLDRMWIERLGDEDVKRRLYALGDHCFICDGCGESRVYSELETIGKWECQMEVKFFPRAGMVVKRGQHISFTVRADHRPKSVKRWNNEEHSHIFPADTLHEWRNRPIDDAIVVMQKAWGGGSGAFKTSGRASVNRWDKWTALDATDRMRSRPYDTWNLVLEDNFSVTYPKGKDLIPHVEPEPGRRVCVRYIRE